MADKTDLPVILSEAAIADLSELGSWIAQQAGSEIAEDYVSRVETACERLGTYPNRGTPRFDIEAGLRTVTYRRKVVIACQVEEACVQVLRLIDTARDFARAFGETKG